MTVNLETTNSDKYDSLESSSPFHQGPSVANGFHKKGKFKL